MGIFLVYEKSLSIKILSKGTSFKTPRKDSALTETKFGENEIKTPISVNCLIISMDPENE